MDLLDSISSLFSGPAGQAAGTATSAATGSIWSDPTFLSSALIAGTSLLSGLFGSSAEDEQSALARDKFDWEKQKYDEQMAQALEIAKLQASGGGAARDAALRQTRAQLMQANAEQQAGAMQLPLAARTRQSAAAQATGEQSGQLYAQLASSLQQPALSRTR